MQRLIGLQREFCIDDDGAGGIGQMDQAIGAASVTQGFLHRIAVGRQRLRHDIIQLDFTERAAGLLVAQDVLQG